MKSPLIGIGIVLIVFSTAFFIFSQFLSSPREASQNTQVQEAQESIPALTLVDYKGNQVSLADLKGKPLLINSWAAWCPFCKEELKDFAAVQKEFGDKILIIAINRGEPLATAQRYTDELGVTNDLVFLLDPTDSFYKAIGGFSMPETIFVDKKGTILDHKRGPMKADEIRERIQKIL